jgi:hypothetical protein
LIQAKRLRSQRDELLDPYDGSLRPHPLSLTPLGDNLGSIDPDRFLNILTVWTVSPRGPKLAARERQKDIACWCKRSFDMLTPVKVPLVISTIPYHWQGSANP